MARIFNSLLAIAILCGVVLSVTRTSQLSEHQAEHDRLSAKFGVLDVRDPSKFLITRIETDDPMHFQWRCYYPAGLKIRENSGFPSYTMGGRPISTEAGDHLQSIHFEPHSNGVRVHYRSRANQARNHALNANLAKFLKDHWDELNIQILATEGPVEIAPDEVVEFLAIRIPKDLRPEFKRSGGSNKLLFYHAFCGTPNAIAAYEQSLKTKAGK